MAKLCAEDNIAMTPYSPLASGRLSKRPGETSKRLEEDDYARFKYNATAKQDSAIIARVAEIADQHGVSMKNFMCPINWLELWRRTHRSLRRKNMYGQQM